MSGRTNGHVLYDEWCESSVAQEHEHPDWFQLPIGMKVTWEELARKVVANNRDREGLRQEQDRRDQHLKRTNAQAAFWAWERNREHQVDHHDPWWNELSENDREAWAAVAEAVLSNDRGNPDGR